MISKSMVARPSLAMHVTTVQDPISRYTRDPKYSNRSKEQIYSFAPPLLSSASVHSHSFLPISSLTTYRFCGFPLPTGT